MKKTSFSICLLLFSLTKGFAQQATDNSVKEIILVFKTHFDIGYTDFAEGVTQKYSTSMMNTALSVIDKSKNLPPEKQFVWTVPGWPMGQILSKSVPSIKARVEQSLKDGRFVVHALPFTLETESADLESLVRGMNISSTVMRQAGLPLARDAKMTDVPSHSWALPTTLVHSGVNFLHLGCNPASQSPHVPDLFWWEGPDGSKLMTMYSGEYYGTSLLPPADWPHKTWLALMLTNDNEGPPTPEAVEEILAEARKSAPQATVKIGRLSDFYDAIIKENPKLPTIKGDMPDTWIHGYMSMPREVKDSRIVSKNLAALEAYNSLYKLWTDKGYAIDNLLYNAYENNLLFNEHTFGMAMSHGRHGTWAYGDDFKVQRAMGAYDDIEKSWKEKADRVFTAEKVVTPTLNRQLTELAMETNVKGRRIVVFNPLPWQRDGVANIKVSTGWNKGKSVKDVETGALTPVSMEKNVIRFIAQDIPAMGYRTYVLTEEEDTKKQELLAVNEQANTIENAYFKITLDPAKGAIASMWDKQAKKELVDQKSEYGFGQYVYERFSKDDAKKYTDQYVKAQGEAWANAELGRPNLTEGPHVTEKGSGAKVLYSQNASGVTATMLFAPTKAIPHDYSLSVTLYPDSRYAELVWNINGKPAESWPEAGWLSFPFNVKDPTFKLGRLGAVVDPATDFVKGSNLDFGFLNTGLSLVDQKNSGIGLSSADAPGVSLDRLGLWKYSLDFVPKRPNVFVNLYNNVWSTNFTEWVEGSWSTKLHIWSVDDYANESAIITPSEELRTPLKVVMVSNAGGDLPAAPAGIQLSKKGVMLTAFGENPDGEGTILRLWEQAGADGKVTITLPRDHSFKTAMLCNLRGEPLAKAFGIKDEIVVDVKAYQPISLVLN